MSRKRKLQSGDIIITILPLYLREVVGAVGYIGVIDESEGHDLIVAYYASDVSQLKEYVPVPLSDVKERVFICPIFDHPNLIQDQQKVSELIKLTARSIDNETN